MKMEEAITDLECLAQSETAGLDDDEREAIGLGIEALRRIEATRLVRKVGTVAPLPGETEE